MWKAARYAVMRVKRLRGEACKVHRVKSWGSCR